MPIDGLEPVRFAQIQAAAAGNAQEARKPEPIPSIQQIVKVSVELSLNSDTEGQSQPAAVYSPRSVLARREESKRQAPSAESSDLYDAIKGEIWRQAFILYQMADRNAVVTGAHSEPGEQRNEALEEVPEYFGVENTGQRIIGLWLGRDQEVGQQEGWLLDAKGTMEQAYSEIAAIFHGLPQLVLDTRDYVLRTLDEMGRPVAA